MGQVFPGFGHSVEAVRTGDDMEPFLAEVVSQEFQDIGFIIHK